MHFRALVEAASDGIVSADVDGKVVSWNRTAIRDVTRRREAEDALRGSEELYRRIIETTHEGVCIADADYRYTFVNRRG